MKKQKMEKNKSQSFPSSTLRCTVEEITKTNTKKSVNKGPLTVKPFMNLHFTMNALQWILVLIFLYLAAGTLIMMIQDGTESLKNIVIYSIIGFFTFFMGYLGWILARDFLEVVSHKKHFGNDLEIEF
jgi:hypothetical protein